jgi:hypothetical protein
VNKNELENTKEIIATIKEEIIKNNEDTDELLQNKDNLIQEFEIKKDENSIETEF